MLKKILLALTCAAALSAAVSSVASAIGEDPGGRASVVNCRCERAIHFSRKGCYADHFGAICASGYNVDCDQYQNNCS